MKTVTTKGFDPEEELIAKAEALADSLGTEANATLVKMVLEQSAQAKTAGIILALADSSIVRHAAAQEWDGALRGLEQVTREEISVLRG